MMIMLNIDRAGTFVGWCGICDLDEVPCDLMRHMLQNDENVLFHETIEPLNKRYTQTQNLPARSILSKMATQFSKKMSKT